MPFAEPVMEEIETSLFDLTKGDILRLAELAGLLLLALIAIFLVVRPALAKLAPEPEAHDAQRVGGAVQHASGAPGSPGAPGASLPAVVDEQGQVISTGAGVTARGATAQAAGSPAHGGGASSSPSGAGDVGGGAAGGLAELEEPSKRALIKQTRDIIEARPDEAAAIVKQWVGQESGSRHG